MNLKSTLFIFLLLGLWNTMLAQLNQSACIQDATILAPGGRTELFFCNGDGAPDKIRFRVTPFAQPFAYLVTDDKNNILFVSRDNNIDFENLPAGNLRVWAFAFKNNILAQPGQNATTAMLADYCYALTQNFIPIRNIVPDGGTVATGDGRSSLFTCAGDGNADVIPFTTTSTDPFYKYVITDENNVILAFADSSAFDFEPLSNERVRVWGVSYVGTLLAEVGDTITSVQFSSSCFDLSDNFIEILRSKPAGGTVSLSNGETSKTLCAEELQNDLLTFIAKNNAATPYAFIVTNDNGIVLEILSGNTATLSISAPGICRVYGVSYTGTLTVQVGDNINSDELSDDCFDVSSNFVRLIKREVDGGLVRLASGGTSSVVCVSEGSSQAVTFANNSTASGSNYSYFVTNENNVIVAIVTNNSFNFATLSGRNLRVWGLSYSGTILANIGDNITTAALSNECYDLSDNFISITRQVVDGAAVSLESGATSAVACTGDGRADLLAFRNTSTSVESYIYVVTDNNGVVLGFINGHQFDFNTLAVDTARVYGLSYSGAFQLSVGGNINNGSLASNCFDLSNNFVTITRTFVDGGMVSLADGSMSAQVCLGGNANGVLSFLNTSTATVSYAYLITDASNMILAISTDDAFDFAGLTGNTFRIWGFSYSGNITAAPGGNATQAVLSDGCYELSSNFVTITTDAVDGGSISLTSGDTTNCLGDEEIQQFTFANTSNATTDTYFYVVTDENGVVVRIETGDTFDLDSLGAGTYQVRGVSITGNATLALGDTLSSAVLSDECYELSSNFVTITQSFTDGGTVSLSDDNNSATLCSNADSTTLRFKNTSSASESSYAYLITDTNNIIIAIATDDSYDFSGATDATYRVWGLSYSGTLTAAVGNNAATADLADGCSELSSNFIAVIRQQVDGATIALAGGATDAVSCLNDSTTQQFVFQNTSGANTDYYYVVTSAPNPTVLAIDTSGTIDFSAFPAGFYQVYGLSVTGNLLLTVGGSILSDTISDACFDLSSNFVTITQSDVDGGTVSLSNDSTDTNLCSSADSTTLLFQNTSTASGSYAYLVTDTNNIIIAIVTDGSYNFEGNTDATFRVWGFSYLGNITAQIGDNAATTVLSDACYELSSNFITVTRQQVDGGTVSLEGGDTSAVACLGVAEIGELTFVNTSTAAAGYVYLVTDTLGKILAVVTDSSYNFNNLPIGTYQVWGLSYTGALTAAVNDNIGELLSDACYDLSSNVITVTQKDVEGGRIALTNGDTSVFVCGNTSTPGTLTFNFNSNANGEYVFLATDRNNRIIVILNGNSISFNGAAIGEYRVWGVSYTGNLLARVGAVLDTLTLSDECFDLSDNFVSIKREATDGGNIAEAGNRTAYTFCPGNGRADVLSFQTTGNSSGSYIYILTDNNNRFISRLTGNSINFDTIPVGSYRIRGVAFSGNLTIQPGANVTTANLSNACFDLSNNFISITNQLPDGGTVALDEGLTETFTCPANDVPDVVHFFRQGVVGSGFVFLVTDTNDIIEAIVPQDSFDFERPTEGINRVYGLAYSGTLTAEIGDTVTNSELSSDCYDLSSNFITIIREIPNGGIVSLENGDSSVFICSNSTDSQVVRFDSSGTSRGDYIYVITDSNNVIRNGIAGDEFDFSFLSPPGVYRVWGLAYTGTLIATIGDTVTNVAISDDCYTLLENFVTVTISSPDGGAITADGSANPILICSEDSVRIQLANNSQALAAAYVYLVTDDSNHVFKIIQNGIFDFEDLNEDSVLIKGLSYAGDLLIQVGDDADLATLASGCFDLSSNFIRVVKANVDGATIGSDRNSSVIYTCYNDNVADLITFSNTSTAGAQYRYVITNENNVIRGVVNANQFNFETAGRGVSRVYGVSFTGTFTGAFGANITTAALSSACFNLSDNFITIARDTVFGGEITGNNQTNLTFCPSPEAPGVVMSTTSEKLTGYQYVLTDVSNTVLQLPLGDTIRFDSLAVGEYRIWGLSYAGDVLVQPGDNIFGVDLASSCYEISANYVTVYRSTLIDGGRVFNLAGGEVLNVCASDTLLDIVVLDNNSDAKDAQYRYVLTDGNNRIILRNVDNEVIDFNQAARGTYHIWGVSYTGNFLPVAGVNLTTAILTDSCYQLSDNFITINVQTPNPGRVLTADSLSAINLTVGDDSSDVVSFIALGAAGGTVDYLVTDSANVVVAIITNDSLDFESFDPGVYRVRSVGYTGNLTVAIGDTIPRAMLSDGCYALSSSSVRVTLSTESGFGSPIQQDIQLTITVAPNPATDQLRINHSWSDDPEPTSHLYIFNLIGQRVYDAQIPATTGDNQYTLGLEDLPDGLYILQLRNGDEVQSVRFLKQWQ